jgi:hypothetical protein
MTRQVIEENIISTSEGTFEKVYKVTEDGLAVFLLPQPPLVTTESHVITVKTSEVSDIPCFVTVQVPKKDAEGNQESYEVTAPKYDEAGEYLGEEPTGQIVNLWLTEQQPEMDNDGNALYCHMVDKPVEVLVPQAPLEITSEDPLYVEGLERAFTLVALPPDPPTVYVPTADQLQIAKLQQANAGMKTQVEALSGDLQSLMDYIFSM